ncbi:MAG: hypothetical protein IEMM0002_0018 [bacterium]|nr:MAG: hypothetical protein IEMM0002_0018 [bacterium]
MRLYHTPSLEFLIALITGILAGRIYGGGTSAYIVSAVVCMVLIIFSTITKKFRWLLILFMAAGFWSINHAEAVFDAPDHIGNFVPSSHAEVTGKVSAPFNYYGGAYRFVLDAKELKSKDGKSTPVSGKVIVKIYGGKNPPLPGSDILLKDVRIKPVLGLRNFDAFDYELYMRDRGIVVRVNTPESRKGKNKIEPVSSGNRLSPRKLGERARRYVMSFIDKTFPPQTAPVAKAMTVAVTGEISQDVRRRFVVSGLAHLLAISGLHVGFISGLTYFVLEIFFFYVFLFLKPRLLESGIHQRPAAIAALLAVALYVLIAGGRVSALRAGIMVGVYFLSAALGREREILNALALSAIIILLFDPAALFSVSFILSYTAVMAIIFMLSYESEKTVDPLDALLPETRFSKIAGFFMTTIKITLAVTVSVAPIVMWFFGEAHFGGLGANVLALPMAAVAIPSTLIGAFLDFAIHPAVGLAASLPAVFAMGGIDTVTKFFSQLDLFSFEGARPPLALVVLWYATLLAWSFFKLRVIKHFALAVTLSLVLIFYMPHARHDTQLHIFDAGQGEAMLVMLESGENILIDGGAKYSRFDTGEILYGRFKELGIKKLDAVIATHGDNDHSGGLATVMKRIDVKRYYDNGLDDDKGMIKKLRRIAEKRGIPYKKLRAGMELPMPDGSRLTVLHPADEFMQNNPAMEDNETSLALMLKTESVSILLTGDMEKKAEKYLLESGADLKADVLKVAHHGSNTSSSAKFLDAVSPHTAVISVGRLNRFRFPSKKVTKRLEKRGVRIYSTKDNGEITLTLSDGKIKTRTFAN